MKQAELIAQIADISGESKKAVEAILKTAADVVTATLYEGGEVTLPGLGKLSAKTKEARVGRNPRTGEPVNIPARRSAHFGPAKALKDALNQ